MSRRRVDRPKPADRRRSAARDLVAAIVLAVLAGCGGEPETGREVSGEPRASVPAPVEPASVELAPVERAPVEIGEAGDAEIPPSGGPVARGEPSEPLEPLALQQDDAGVPFIEFDADAWAAYAAWCRHLSLPAPPAVEDIDAVGFVMIHRAVREIAAERTVPALARLAFLYDGNQAPEPALRLYDELIERAPDEFAFHHLRGRLLAGLDRREEALAAFRRATAIRGDVAATWFRRGELELESGNREAAGRSFTRYAELGPEDGLADYGLARIDLAEGRQDAARERLERSVAARPDLAAAWLLLAQVRARTGDPDGAREANDRARGLGGSSSAGLVDPVESEMYRQAQSIAYLQAGLRANESAGRVEEAYDFARRLVARRPDNALEVRNLAVLAKRLGRIPEAVRHAERAVALEPGRTRNLTTLAELYRDAGRLAEALETAERAVRQEPDSAVPRIVLAATLLAAGRPGDALEAAEQAVELAPERIESLVVQAAVLGALGRTSEARQAADRILEIDPENRWARSVLAQLDRQEAGEPAEPADPPGGEAGGEAPSGSGG